MKGWIISVVGICLISVVIDLMLPDGKINASVKRVVCWAIMFVILLPLPKFLKGQYNLTEIFNDTILVVQEEYLYNFNRDKLTLLETKIQDELKQNFIDGVEIYLSANVFDVNMEINAVYVNLSGLVINDKIENIDIKTKILNIIKNNMAVKEGEIIFYE